MYIFARVSKDADELGFIVLTDALPMALLSWAIRAVDNIGTLFPLLPFCGMFCPFALFVAGTPCEYGLYIYASKCLRLQGFITLIGTLPAVALWPMRTMDDGRASAGSPVRCAGV